jgi:predicted RNase H-like HicB family nuclease
MQFEVEIYVNEAKEWVATAIAYGVTAKGRTEKEVLALLMEALATHFKKGGAAAGGGRDAAR